MHTVATLSMRALHLKLAASRQLATCDDMPTARPKANAHSVHEATTKSHRAQKRALRRVECSALGIHLARMLHINDNGNDDE